MSICYGVLKREAQRQDITPLGSDRCLQHDVIAAGAESNGDTKVDLQGLEACSHRQSLPP